MYSPGGLSDVVYCALRLAAEAVGAYVDDEADDLLRVLAEHLAQHPISNIEDPDDHGP